MSNQENRKGSENTPALFRGGHNEPSEKDTAAGLRRGVLSLGGAISDTVIDSSIPAATNNITNSCSSGNILANIGPTLASANSCSLLPRLQSHSTGAGA